MRVRDGEQEREGSWNQSEPDDSEHGFRSPFLGDEGIAR